jgi:DNA-binding response OmpR family regulator
MSNMHAPQVAGSRRAESKRVLVVDDNRDTTEALGRLLCMQGFEVELAHSFHEARAQLRQSFDVLVADVRLPDGSGLELLREAGEKTRGIAMSGMGSRDDVQRSLDAGFTLHLLKPFEMERLIAAIRAL